MPLRRIALAALAVLILFLGGGIAAGTKWADVPDDFVCPLCGVGKDMFEEQA